jgi:DHA1 family bicyclomycin/chloramphenicol resistance-like MFS transporter
MTRVPSRLFGLSLASIALIGPLAVHLFLPVIPAVKAALGLSDAFAQLAFSISLFGMAFATLAYGSLSDRYGRRPVLLSGLCLFLIGSIISVFSNSVTVLIIGRLVQAIGAGCGITLVRAIARDAYGAEHLVKAIAYLTMFYTLGPMISPLVGGVLVDNFGWRSVFGFALAAAAVIATGAYFAIYETRPPQEHVQSNVSIARSYLELFGHPRFTAFVLQSGFVTGAFITVASAAPTLMKELLHRPATEFGFYFVMFPVGFFCGNLIASGLGGRVAAETMVLAGSSLLMTTIVVQATLLLSGHVVPLTLFVPGFFITLSQGLALPNGQAAAIATVPRLAGTAAGIGVFIQHFCGAGFAQLYGFLSDGTPGPMIVTAGVSASLCLIAGAIPYVLARMTPATSD